MARLTFNTQITRKQDLRNKPSKYDQSLLRNTIRDLGHGDTLSDVFYPYKYLPVQMKDVSTEEYIVIPKGRVVSLLTHGNGTVPTSGMLYPSSASSVYIGKNGLDDSAMTSLIDDSYFGYPNHVAGLLVPANGGTVCSGQYTSRDTDAGWLVSAAALDAAPVMSGNLPIGITIADVYQDIRGMYLNYQVFDKPTAIWTDTYIEMPYIKIAVANIASKTVNPGTPEIPGTAHAFNTFNSKHTYLTISDADITYAGVPVVSDIRGNYKLINAGTAISTTAPAWTCQCVGKLILTGCRYPKDDLNTVDTYEGSNMPGTATAGLPTHLFHVAHDYLVATSASHRLADVVTAVQAGTFGTAHILINI